MLCRAQYAKEVDKSCFPGIRAGPLMHVIAAKAVAFGEACGPTSSIRRIPSERRLRAGRLTGEGFRIVSGGTDSHLMLVDLRPFGVLGKIAQSVLDRAACLNKTPPLRPGKAVRPGNKRAPAVTTRAWMSRK